MGFATKALAGGAILPGNSAARRTARWGGRRFAAVGILLPPSRQRVVAQPV